MQGLFLLGARLHANDNSSRNVFYPAAKYAFISPGTNLGHGTHDLDMDTTAFHCIYSSVLKDTSYSYGGFVSCGRIHDLIGASIMGNRDDHGGVGGGGMIMARSVNKVYIRSVNWYCVQS